MQVCTSDETCRLAKISELFVYENFTKIPAEDVEAGDICAVCGISDIMVSILRFAFLQLSASIVLRITYGIFKLGVRFLDEK